MVLIRTLPARLLGIYVAMAGVGSASTAALAQAQIPSLPTISRPNPGIMHRTIPDVPAPESTGGRGGNTPPSARLGEPPWDLTLDEIREVQALCAGSARPWTEISICTRFRSVNRQRPAENPTGASR